MRRLLALTLGVLVLAGLPEAPAAQEADNSLPRIAERNVLLALETREVASTDAANALGGARW